MFCLGLRCNVQGGGGSCRNFVRMFDADKTRMIGLPYGGKNYDNMLSRFHLIPERHGQTDRQTDRIAISISRVSVLTRNKKDDDDDGMLPVIIDDRSEPMSDTQNG